MKKTIAKLCGSSGCCPTVVEEDAMIKIGEDDEWAFLTKEQFGELVSRAKNGEFDNVIKGNA